MTYQTKPYKLQASTEERITNKIATPPGMLAQKVTRTQAYEEREPIIITSDSDLNDSKVTGFTGNGTIDDPILIKGYNITYESGDLISISHTTFYFRITDCLINGLGTIGNGIYFNNVTHGTIVNNTIYNNGWSGINVARRSDFNIIANNTIFDNSEDGIRLGEANPSHNNTVHNNTIYNNGWKGIRVDASDNNIIEYNTIHSCSGGIELLSSSWNTVSNNTVYNCDWNGIRVDASDNNTIEYNTIHSCSGGIELSSSSRNTVSNNTIYNNSNIGVFIIESDNVTISSNEIYQNNASGINILNGSFNSVLSNELHANYYAEIIVGTFADHNKICFNTMSDGTNSTGSGILVVYSAQYNLVSKNTIFNIYGTAGINMWQVSNNSILQNNISSNYGYGVHIYESNNNSVTENIIAKNEKCGITLLGNNNIIRNNTVSRNSWYGIEINSTSNAIVKWNDFIQNNPSGDSQAKDDEGNDFDGNFWDEWISPDANNDGFVDEKYPLDGDAHNFDYTPLTQPGNLIGIHFVSRALLIFPSGGETLVGVITIQWTTPIDSSDHSFMYELFYSNDEGATWTLIASELTDTSYPWNTTTVPNGLSYLIKVKTICSEGESSEGISEGTFEIRNEIKTTTTATSATSDDVPGIPGILAGICLVSFILLRKGRKK